MCVFCRVRSGEVSGCEYLLKQQDLAAPWLCGWLTERGSRGGGLFQIRAQLAIGGGSPSNPLLTFQSSPEAACPHLTSKGTG